MRSKFSEIRGQKVHIVEVALRDGLQNEKTIVSVVDRIELANRLLATGVRSMELGSFVRADKVPQMEGTAQVVKGVLSKAPKSEPRNAHHFSVLVPNLQGLEMAIQNQVTEVAVFTAASESFTKANINCTIEESFERFAPVLSLAKKNKIKVRGYLSTAFGCPFEGKIDQGRAVELAARLIKIGCYQVSIGDTIGVGTPGQVFEFMKALKKKVPLSKVAGHFHDTRGTALANVLASVQAGVFTFDSSLGGIGGCPYAPGASGNVSTEDVLYMLQGMGLNTGIDLNKYIETSRWFSGIIGRNLSSGVARAGSWPKTQV